MFFKKQIRKAFINRRWGLLLSWVFIAIFFTIVFIIFEDRIANWANSQIDNEWPDIMEWFFTFLSLDIFPVIALLLIGALAIIGFAILYKRAGQPTARKEDYQPSGVEISRGNRKETGVATQLVARAIHNQLDSTQQVAEELQPKELTESEKWWEQYRPSCEIVKVDFLEITKNANEYHFELPIDVKYTSRDPRYSTRMDCTTILLDVFHLGRGREIKPYRLHSSGLPLRIDEESIKEGRYKVEIQQKWDLPSNESRIIRYTFEGLTEGEPLVEKETFCRISHIGIPLIHNVNINKPLILIIEDSKFPITVDDGKFLVKVNKQY